MLTDVLPNSNFCVRLCVRLNTNNNNGCIINRTCSVWFALTATHYDHIIGRAYAYACTGTRTQFTVRFIVPNFPAYIFWFCVTFLFLTRMYTTIYVNMLFWMSRGLSVSFSTLENSLHIGIPLQSPKIAHLYRRNYKFLITNWQRCTQIRAKKKKMCAANWSGGSV